MHTLVLGVGDSCRALVREAVNKDVSAETCCGVSWN